MLKNEIHLGICISTLIPLRNINISYIIRSFLYHDRPTPVTRSTLDFGVALITALYIRDANGTDKLFIIYASARDQSHEVNLVERKGERPRDVTGQDFPRMFRNKFRGRNSTTAWIPLTGALPKENR